MKFSFGQLHLVLNILTENEPVCRFCLLFGFRFWFYCLPLCAVFLLSRKFSSQVL